MTSDVTMEAPPHNDRRNEMTSNSSAQDFLDKLETDAEFREALSGAPHPAGKINIIRNSGFVFTSEELNDAMVNKEVSQTAKDYARDAINNIAPQDTDYSTVGEWYFFSTD